MPYEQLIPWVISAISVIVAIYFNSASSRRNTKKDIEEDTATAATVIVKLESISNDLKEIKVENRQTRSELMALRERVAVVENSLKSYHKRLDMVVGRADD